MTESTEKVLDLTFTFPCIVDAESLVIPTWDIGGTIDFGSPADAMYTRAWSAIWANTRPDTYWLGRTNRTDKEA